MLLESRMRSRTSRGVSEWSGGEDLYMGSCHADTEKFRGHIGIVPGPLEGFQGSTRRGHPSLRATWAARGREPEYNSRRSPSPPQHLSSSVRAWRSPVGVLLHQLHHAVVLPFGAAFLNLSFLLAGSRQRRRRPYRTCVERGGVVRSALGHR